MLTQRVKPQFVDLNNETFKLLPFELFGECERNLSELSLCQLGACCSGDETVDIEELKVRLRILKCVNCFWNEQMRMVVHPGSSSNDVCRTFTSAI